MRVADSLQCEHFSSCRATFTGCSSHESANHIGDWRVHRDAVQHQFCSCDENGNIGNVAN